VTLVRGADDDLRLTREPHGHDPRGFSWPGPVVPAFTRGPLSPLPASWPALANRWQHFGRPRKQRSGGLELGPTRQSRWGGPAGLSDRSGAQAGFEPAVAADKASLSSAPLGRYRLSTPVHCRCERHPDACWRSFGIATQFEELEWPSPRHRAGGAPTHHRTCLPLGRGSRQSIPMVTTLRPAERQRETRAGPERALSPPDHRGDGRVGSGLGGTTMSTQLHHRGCAALRAPSPSRYESRGGPG